MYQINVNFGTGRLIASGLRNDFLDGSAADIRPIDAAEFIPTGSHRFVPSVTKNVDLYYVYAESNRGNQF
jgi:hypothetical protein